jgi:hypothetical protein
MRAALAASGERRHQHHHEQEQPQQRLAATRLAPGRRLHGVRDHRARDADGLASATGTEGKVSTAHANRRTHAMLAQVQANAWKDAEGTAKVETHAFILDADSGIYDAAVRATVEFPGVRSRATPPRIARRFAAPTVALHLSQS